MSVHALALSASHQFTKTLVPEVNLLAGLGVEGDCHLGVTVQHRSRLHISPPPPNLRQVHLIPKEILDACDVAPGQMGENVTTIGIDLLALGKGTKLHFLPPPPTPTTPSTTTTTITTNTTTTTPASTTDEDDNATATTLQTPHAVVVIQGLRNPCPQIDRFRAGLKEQFIVRDGERRIVGRTAGVMGTVEAGGLVEGGGEVLGCV
ncbi:pyruvate kinase-like protein [Chaetomium fimeti]|uniref:Pyruvate kinase-like protein n=1 Tax=Chaetomium fimeti TaxID=1854472 RepID=A0AAE0LMC6_9PEZI|nr:pyruvate kinase-like protein [Chaetomium fimeti]